MRAQGSSYAASNFDSNQTSNQRSAAHMANYEYSLPYYGWLHSMAITLENDPFVVKSIELLASAFIANWACSLGLDDGFPL